MKDLLKKFENKQPEIVFHWKDQETEAEGFEEQGIIAYNGAEKTPNVQLGEYSGLTYYSQIDNRWKNKIRK